MIKISALIKEIASGDWFAILCILGAFSLQELELE